MEELALTRAGAGRPLLLVHGYLGGAEMWAPRIEVLAKSREVIAPDLPGFGRSAALIAPDRIGGFAARLVALMDRLEHRSFDVMGHSMGGMIAQEIALTHPGRVKTLILCGTGAEGVLPGRFETIDRSRQRLREDGVAATARRIAATWFLGGEAAEGFALCARLGAAASLQAALASLDAWEAWRSADRLADIGARTLVLWSTADRSYPFSQIQTLWTGIPGADLAVIPGAGHNAHMERPALFDAIVTGFLDRAP